RHQFGAGAVALQHRRQGTDRGRTAHARLLPRLQRLLQSEEAGRARLPRSPAFTRRSPLGPHPPDPAGSGDPQDRRRAVPEARQDRGTGRRHLQRGIRDPEQVAAPARAVLDRPDPVSALRLTTSRQAKPAQDRQPDKKNTSQAHRPGFPDRCVFVFWPEKTGSEMELIPGTSFISPYRRTEVMLVERGLRVMNVEAVGDAYAIAANYLRKTGAIADTFATNDALLEIIVQMFHRGEYNKIRLANKAIAPFEAT